MTIISNNFYVSRFLMESLDSKKYNVFFEKELEKENKNKFFLRIRAFFFNKSYCKKEVIAFAIENIITLDYVYRNIGVPKVWLWNPVSSMTKKNKILFLAYVRLKKISVWTFDFSDAKKYGFFYHCQIHSSSLISNDISNGESVFFSGVDKGRLNKIKEIISDLTYLPLSLNFHIVRDKKQKYVGDDLEITTDTYLNFDEYLNMVSHCSVLVDVPQNKQSGITLRVLESLFQNKKLISTDSKIKETDFYHPHNIYIFGDDDRTIKEFLDEPMYDINYEIKCRYTLEHLLGEML